MSLWLLVAGAALGCYALKLAGFLVPAHWLEIPQMRRFVEILPVALLAALVIVEGVAQGRRLEFDAARLAGFAVGAVAVWRRAPFLVIVILAGLTAAMIRLA